MARAAAEADICILTSDNPNHEHPASIIRDMIAGLRPSEQRAELRTIVDRQTAIEKAIELAMPDGVVVLLGKGTERFQLIEGKRFPHNDRAVAERILEKLASSRA
jgi:UDP-N-acetylmuramoyl-L-alanyl-D-glutamate--2,6-diaminopimelate ligase